MIFFNYLYNLLDIPPLFFKLQRRLKIQKSFLESVVMPEIRKRMETNDGTIDVEDIKKIEKYYGLSVPAIFEAYSDLRGKPLSVEERTAATFLAASTGLFDDFFDRNDLTDEYIGNLYNFPETYSGQNSNEQLANFFWTKALSFTTSPSLLKQQAANVHAAQIESRKQKSTDLAPGILRDITYNKGGYSVIFFFSLFFENMPPDEENLFYNIGAILQLENDIFDVYKDDVAGIKTLVTSPESIEHLREMYQTLWDKVKLGISAVPYSKPGKKAFKKILCVLVGRGFVCLDMLQKREDENNGKFDPKIFTRKQLICDMEKPLNILRNIHYYALIL